MPIKFDIAGDQAILVQIGEEINDSINKKVRTLAFLVENNSTLGFEEVILGYTNLLVFYNPVHLNFNRAIDILKDLIKEMDSEEMDYINQRIVEIPVVYGDEWGPDLEDVAKYNNISREEVIHLHKNRDYLVYTLGFTPGFAYFGGMSKKIATPRLESPRVIVPAGSVGIANNQTGIYPISSPGGWRLIGRTPLHFFDLNDEPPFLLQPGDIVKIREINADEFRELDEKVKNKEKVVYPKVMTN